MINKILVIYIGVAGIRSEDIETYTHKVANKIIPTTFEGEIIIIPVQSHDCKIECINPEYITDKDLVQKHTELMVELKNNLKHQLSQLNNDDK